MRSTLIRAGLLSVALTMMSASAAMAVTIKPLGSTIQLKATNISMSIWPKQENVTCELFQASAKTGLGTLPIKLEAITFGKGAGECKFPYAGLVFPARVVSTEKLELSATSKTSATLGAAFGNFVLQLEEPGAEEKKECTMRVTLAPGEGVWANGTTKEKKVVTPSTLTMNNTAVSFLTKTKCNIWGPVAQEGTMSATFNVTDTTEPNSLVVLE